MYKNKKILALIPARGGSKRLPKKNIKFFLGKPLIAWTIKQANNSKYVDRVIVSTDDDEIAEISKRYGSEVPFLRPENLATDDAKGIAPVLHAIDWCRNNDTIYDILILLQPTSPLRLDVDIDSAIEMLFLKNARAVVSVCRVECSPDWINILPHNGCMANFMKLRQEQENEDGQERLHFYRLNGAIYVAFCDYLLEKKSFLGDRTFSYIMPKERSVDIDDEMDFMFAEFLMMNKNGKRKEIDVFGESKGES